MASATKSKQSKSQKSKSKSEAARREKLKEQVNEFRENQRTEAKAQAQTSDNAVPEQRPQAFAEGRPDLESKQQKLREERGDNKPMNKSAHDRAASSGQLEKAEQEERHLGPETLREGTRVRIIDGDYEGSAGAIIEVEYASFEDRQKAMSGDPSVARFAKASSYMVRTRGGAHALVNVKPDQIEQINVLGINVSEA